MSDWVDEYVKPVILVALGGGGVWAFLKALAASRATEAVAKIKAPSDLLGAMAAFQQALNAQAEAITAGLREDNQRLEGRITELEAENEQCRGENRQMSQRLGSLESYLRRRGIDVPGMATADSLTVVEGDGVTSFVVGGKAGEA